MEGQVTRGVDFNLKKDDLMLLILEGRKEQMEEEIGKLQNVSTALRKDLVKAEEKFKTKVTKRVSKTLNAEAVKLAGAFSRKGANLDDAGEDSEADDADEVSTEGAFKIGLHARVDASAAYTQFSSKPIGDGKGATYIKQQGQSAITFNVYNRAVITMEFSIHGKTFAKKDPMFKRKDYVQACSEYSKTFTILDEALDVETQQEMAEYKVVKEVAEKIAANEQLLSDILAEYDLFSRNQPRAKANMIKQVLSRDDSGQALLENIFEAAKGVKLLAVEGPKKNG
jgi:hypothetical protein